MKISQRLTARVACLGIALFAWSVSAADKAQIQQAISKGSGFLKQGLAQRQSSLKSLSYVALLKAGEATTSPLMAEAATHVTEKTKTGKYLPSTDQIYEAGVDATLLADLDGEKYRPQIQLIADYITENQSPQGCWNYLPPRVEKEREGKGDVSVTHYACLGLWAAARAGVKVEPQIWVKILNWMNSNNNPDGGYSYNPGTELGEFRSQSTLNMTVNSVGIMCIAMLNLDPKRLPDFNKGSSTKSSTAKKTPSSKDARESKPVKEAAKPAGVLEAVNLDKEEEEKSAETLKAATGRIPEKSYGSARTALQWVSARFVTVNPAAHGAYYYYSLERMGALANVSKLDGRDWYEECAEELLARQNPDGSWKISGWGSAEYDTCFAVLFLTRSTGKILKRTVITSEPPVGGGLLSGGRGLPDDLSQLDANGNVRKKKGEKSSLDDLLAALQDSDTSSLEDTQSELVQMVQLGDKKQLIGQKDKLVMLVAQPNPEVRRTAIWAIGRTGDLSLARYAVLALDDPDLGVMTEAHLALSWTARKPGAFKLPLNPLDGVPSDAPQDEKAAAIESWRRQALRLWGEWYLRNRPYSDRGDEFETNLRNRLLQLQ